MRGLSVVQTALSYGLLSCLSLAGAFGWQDGTDRPLPSVGERYQITFQYFPAVGLGQEERVCRRDPSDIINVDGRCYVWYSKIRRENALPGLHGYPSGYQGSVWFAVSTDEGHTWNEVGQAIPKGESGTFDSTATFSPNILVFQNRYYLYYTAVGPGFDNGPYADRNRTSIGVAAAESPEGPWMKLLESPILLSSSDRDRFDSYRVDDSCFVVRDNKIWMYFKGRQWENTPANTKMGVAVASKPDGPFERLNGGRFIQDSGHEVLVWPFNSGVISLVSNSGPNRLTLQYAADGINFGIVGQLPAEYPKAPGVFRADLTDPAALGRGADWGISMATYGPDPYLHRFQIELTSSRATD
ncbi:MAG TPA: family 43 glycosylhydrolase [Acidobacteriota bacterium]|nr:family 43 glycosylhydrolase [Acidobacteriota bacterium]